MVILYLSTNRYKDHVSCYVLCYVHESMRNLRNNIPTDNAINMSDWISVVWQSGGNRSIKTLSYQYRNSYYKDKTVSWPSDIHNGNPHTWKDSIYIEMGPRFLFYSILFYFILFQYILFYSILFCSILFYSNILYSILFYTWLLDIPAQGSANGLCLFRCTFTSKMNLYGEYWYIFIM